MKRIVAFALALTLFSCTKEDLLLHKPPVQKPVVVETIYPNVLYLKFFGGVVEGTSWNTDGPMQMDSSGLNADQIREVLNSVKAAYDTFKVTVTMDSAIYNHAPVNSRQSCYVTKSWAWWGKAGGTSYNGSFVWGDGTPCFVFSSLLTYDARIIGEAASHEFGHTLGLRHQALFDSTGKQITDYNPGNADTAPIMGNPYKSKKAVWWKGQNSYNQLQDDVAILGKALGFK